MEKQFYVYNNFYQACANCVNRDNPLVNEIIEVQ